MPHTEAWDFEPGARSIVDVQACARDYSWLEEPVVSPDGERVAMVAVGEDGGTLCVNGKAWESTFEKCWLPKFLPDGRLMTLAQEDGEWTVAVDDQAWEQRFAFVWNPMVSQEGSRLAVSIQQDGEYGVAVEDATWETLYENATNFAMSRDGSHTAAVVQTISLGQADIEGYQKGVYSVATDGESWDSNFVNCWAPAFNRKGDRVAAAARFSLYDYGVLEDGQPWPDVFQCVWEPLFDPTGGGVLCPARKGGLWGLATRGGWRWEPVYQQVWQAQFSENGRHLGAIVAPRFGQFTVALDGKPWDATFPVVTDLAISDTGRAACLARVQTHESPSHWNSGGALIVVDGKAWSGRYDMAWPPVFSPNGASVAAAVEKHGRQTIVVDDKVYKEWFDKVWPPAFDPSGEKVLIRALSGGVCLRIVDSIASFKA